jgi:arylsulfatase A-like enzyme
MKILVLHVNGLHLGYLGCYGSDWVQTPNLDRLAAEGIVFDQHVANCPRLSASCSITGQFCFPSADGRETRGEKPALPALLDSHRATQTVLGGQGKSAKDLLVSFRKKLPAWGKSERGLLWLDWPVLAPPWTIPDDILDGYFVEVEEEEDALIPWLDPPTGPMAPEDQERLQTTYAALVTDFDAQVGTILETLAERKLLEDTWFILTGSCGLALGEHGYVGEHRAWLHEEIVHVPLIVRQPGAANAGGRIDSLTQPVDLLPTVLDILGLPPRNGPGHSLLPLIRGEVEQIHSHACSGLALGYSVEWAIRTPQWALLLPLSTPPEDPPRAPQLLVKPEDRWEVNDVRQHHLELAEELEQTLRTEASKFAALSP